MYKIFGIALIITLLLSSIQAQVHRDSILLYAKENSSNFWEMVAQFYPLKKEMAFQYQDVLNNRELGKNKVIDWDEEYISLYLDKYPSYFWGWSQITYFNKIKVSKEFYNIHKQSISDKVIVENSDSVFLYNEWKSSIERENPNILKAYIKAFRYKIYRDTNKIPQFLKKHLNDSIKNLSVKFLIQNKEFLVELYTAPLDWTFSKLDSLYSSNYGLFGHRKYPSQEIYNDIFKQHLDDDFISYIYTTLYPDSLTIFYKIRSNSTNVNFEKDIFYTRDRFNGYGYDEIRFQPYYPKTIPQTGYSLDEDSTPPIIGKDFHEFWFSPYHFPVCLVSLKMKNILEDYNLPFHKFYSIRLRINSPNYGMDTLNYYLFVTDHSVLDDMIFDNNVLCNTKTLFKDIVSKFDTSYFTVKNLNEFQYYSDSIPYSKNKKSYYKLRDLYFNSDLDLLSFKGGQFWISEDLKEALEFNEISGIYYTRSDKTRIHMLDLNTKNHSNRKIVSYNKDPNPLLHQRILLRFNDAIRRRDSILNLPAQIIDFYNKMDSSKLDSIELSLRKMEIKLDVLLPLGFRKFLKNLAKINKKWHFEFMKSIDIGQIRALDKEWLDNYPKLVKGIIIAEDGGDNSLILLLNKNSAIQLGSIIYKLEHDTGKLTIVKINDNYNYK